MVLKDNGVELYLVMGNCACTAVTGLWFMNCVLWLFLLAVKAALTGVQLSGTSGKSHVCSEVESPAGCSGGQQRSLWREEIMYFNYEHANGTTYCPDS